jgi:hypothetical protein
VLRLVIEKVMVRDHHVSIYFKIPIESRLRPVPVAPVRESTATPVSTEFGLRSTHGYQGRVVPVEREAEKRPAEAAGGIRQLFQRGFVKIR